MTSALVPNTFKEVLQDRRGLARYLGAVTSQNSLARFKPKEVVRSMLLCNPILSYSFWIYLDGWLVPGLFVRPQIEDHIPPDVFSPPAFSGPIDDNATSCSRALAASKYDEEQ